MEEEKRKCAECNRDILLKRKDAQFCSADCRYKYRNRNMQARLKASQTNKPTTNAAISYSKGDDYTVEREW